ncbi:MAG: MFS transporter [Trueperaceae bacterium]|nr:MAG: MFS transporter [Trueperaceae bacterium]
MAVTPLTKHRPILLGGGGLYLLLTLAHASNDGFFGMFSALLPSLQQRFELSETTLALLVATLSVSTSVVQPLFGALADRLGRRLVSAAGTVLCSSLLSLVAVAPNLSLLVFVLFAGGLGSAAFHPSGMSLARMSGGARKGLAVGFFGAGGALGMAIGPVVILYVITHFGVGFSPWLMVPGVLAGVALFVFLPPQARASGREVKLFDLQLLTGPVGLLCLAGIFRATSFVTFNSAMPLWLVKSRNFAPDDALIGWTLATFTFAAAAGGFLAGGLADRFDRRTLTVGSLLVALPALFAVFLFPPGSLAYFVLIALAGLTTNASLPLLILSGQDLAPHALATASGMMMGLSWGIAGLLYIGIGRLQETLGISTAMGLGYLLLLPATVLVYLVLSRYRSSFSHQTPG